MVVVYVAHCQLIADGEPHAADGELHAADGKLHAADGELHAADGDLHAAGACLTVVYSKSNKHLNPSQLSKKQTIPHEE